MEGVINAWMKVLKERMDKRIKGWIKVLKGRKDEWMNAWMKVLNEENLIGERIWE